jgi:hypothetical protein
MELKQYEKILKSLSWQSRERQAGLSQKEGRRRWSHEILYRIKDQTKLVVIPLYTFCWWRCLRCSILQFTLQDYGLWEFGA